MKKHLCFFLTILIFQTNIFSQNKPAEFRLTLRDGNTVTGTSDIAKVSLTTDYGKLEIPIQNVSSLDLGIAPDKTNEDKIIGMVKQLNNSNEEMRKNAYDQIVKLDIKAIPAISNFIYSAKYEPGTYADYTIESALSELKSNHNVDDDFTDKDVVSIDYQYSMGGVYDFKKIDLKTEYGSLSIPKEKIKHIDVMFVPTGSGSEMTFILNASKNISSNTNGGWLKTGIMVKTGQKISISATGEVVLASLSNQKYKPDGKTVGSTTTDDYNYDDGNAASTYPTYGNVVYKIGEASTETLKAGAKFSGTAKQSGMLFLSIYETVYNAANTGSYTARVSLK